MLTKDAKAGQFLKRITINRRVQELRVKTVKYFKSIERAQDEVEIMQARPDSIQATAVLVKVGNLDYLNTSGVPTCRIEGPSNPR